MGVRAGLFSSCLRSKFLLRKTTARWKLKIDFGILHTYPDEKLKINYLGGASVVPYRVDANLNWMSLISFGP